MLSSTPLGPDSDGGLRVSLQWSGSGGGSRQPAHGQQTIVCRRAGVVPVRTHRVPQAGTRHWPVRPERQAFGNFRKMPGGPQTWVLHLEYIHGYGKSNKQQNVVLFFSLKVSHVVNSSWRLWLYFSSFVLHLPWLERCCSKSGVCWVVFYCKLLCARLMAWNTGLRHANDFICIIVCETSVAICFSFDRATNRILNCRGTLYLRDCAGIDLTTWLSHIT